ncbi:MAG TPA: hypothetical protein DIT07_14525 [Sphingobacteriaceae bacterium]|nr:hypothetical protein [Sphingobacteriaceae bacterium]
MKRVLLFAITAIYLLSCIGVAVNCFYCCGELKSVSIVAASQESENCNMPVKKDGCCDQSSQTFKVKDQHLASGSIPPASLPIIGIIQSFHLFDLALPFSVRETSAFNYHAPPILSGTAIHTLNCTFRI